MYKIIGWCLICITVECSFFTGYILDQYGQFLDVSSLVLNDYILKRERKYLYKKNGMAIRVYKQLILPYEDFLKD